MCHCSNLYHVYKNNYNNNYSFIILLTRCPSHNLFVSNTLIRQIFTVGIFKYATSHKTDTITTGSLCLAFLYTHTFSLQMFSACACAFSHLSAPHTCWWFIWKVFYILVYYCVGFLYICVIYLFHAHDLCSCSFCLLFLVLNDVRSFRFP